jgi:uncharacterized protein YidB (DUF937 family)
VGMLDQILGGLTGQAGQSGNSMQGGSLMDLATSMIQGQSGGLGGLLAKFQSAGLGEQADSWVSTGANKPVTPDQMSSALGSNSLASMAQKFGINPQMAGAALATLLPMVIDHLTPKGRVEPSQNLDTDLSALRSKYMA